MIEEVKSCPFCGGKEVRLFYNGVVWVVECRQCLAKIGAKLEKDAVDFWNYRPKEEKLGEQIREMKQKNAELKREILEAREDNADNMEYHVAERERLKAEIEELEGSVAFAERMRVLDLLKTCCNEFVKSRFKPCRRVKTVDAKGRCTGRATCPIYAELTKGAKNEM